MKNETKKADGDLIYLDNKLKEIGKSKMQIATLAIPLANFVTA
jgi:hypothetical protein